MDSGRQSQRRGGFALPFACALIASLSQALMLSGCAPERAQAQQLTCDCDVDPNACDQGCSCDPICGSGHQSSSEECNAGNLYKFCKCSCDTNPNVCDQGLDSAGNRTSAICWCDQQCGKKSAHTGRIAARGIVLRDSGSGLIAPTGIPTWVEYDLIGQHRNLRPHPLHAAGDATLVDENTRSMSVADYNVLATALRDARQASGSIAIAADFFGIHECTSNGQTVYAQTVLPALAPTTHSVVIAKDTVGTDGKTVPPICSALLRFESPLAADSPVLDPTQPCQEEGGSGEPPCRSVFISEYDGKLIYRTAFIAGRESAFLAFNPDDGMPSQCLAGGLKPGDDPPDDQFVLDSTLYNELLAWRAHPDTVPKPANIPENAVNMNLAEAQAFNDCRTGSMVVSTNENCPNGQSPCQTLRAPSPIAGAVVELVDSRVYHVDRTDAGGFYSIFYPTPVEWFEFDVNATLAFSAFNPRVPSSKYYYLTQVGNRSAFQDPVVDDGFPAIVGATLGIGVIGVPTSSGGVTLQIANSNPQTQSNFPVDASMLAVTAYVTNTGFGHATAPGTALDLVGVPQSAGGSFNLELAYDPSPRTDEAGVEHRGLLKSISVPDLRDSEIYVFRQSDGYLIGSRWGFTDREVVNGDVDVNRDGTIGPGDLAVPDCHDKACLMPIALIRGGGASFTGVTEQKYNAGVNIPPVLSKDGKTQLKPGRFGIELDYGRNVSGSFRPQLRPDDLVKIVVVNRSTGYIGTTLAKYTSDARGMSSFVAVNPSLCQGLPRLSQQSGLPCVIMRPPNLKVKVERTRSENGGPASSPRTYVVGFEGSGLTSDVTIAIHTDWFDADGTPLPSDLPGFTGRLAKTVLDPKLSPQDIVSVTGPNGTTQQVGLVGDDSKLLLGTSGGVDPALIEKCRLAGSDKQMSGPENKPAYCAAFDVGGENLTGLFPIRPGSGTAVVKLPQKGADRAHFYVHVDAQSTDRNIDFMGRPEPAKPSFSLRSVCFSTCVDDSGVDRCAATNVDVSSTAPGWTCVERPVPSSYKVDGSATDAAAPYLQRPSSYVPFLVARYNATRTDAADAAAKAAHLPAPPPVYDWGYRPETQFSLFDLDATKLEVVKGAESQQVAIVGNTVGIPGDIDSVSLHYALTGSDVGELLRFGAPRELVFALNDTGVAATFGADQRAEFGRAAVESAVSADDLITLRLYQSGDEGNVLWESNVDELPLEIGVDNNHDGVIELKTDPLTLTNRRDLDVTSKEKPYRFWLNNDLDIVNNAGTIETNLRHCPSGTQGLPVGTPDQHGAGFGQTCEQLDADPSEEGKTNLSDLEHIESERDLEDFSPMAIYAPWKHGPHSQSLPTGVQMTLIAHGVGINVFKGAWSARSVAYLEEPGDAERQADSALYPHLFTLHPDQKHVLTGAELDTLFAPDGDDIGRVIFEGVDASPDSCGADGCYVQVAYERAGEEPISTSRVYLEIRPTTYWYDHYTLGRDYGQVPSAAPSVVQEAKQNLFEGQDPDTTNYILMVHGWRMQDSERVQFGETMFKRLYWAGYRGRFGMMSWPTGWFPKPAWLYDFLNQATINALVFEPHNYDSSEINARRSAVGLATLIRSINGRPSTDNWRVNLVAHSMGNAVVSETMRYLGTDARMVASYVASQGAIDAGSFNSNVPDMEHHLLTGILCPAGLTVTDPARAEDAWRCYNPVLPPAPDGPPPDPRILEGAMPPDWYRYAGNVVHPAGVSRYPNAWRHPYFLRAHDWTTEVRFVNFHNRPDAALSIWELNQLTKPDDSVPVFYQGTQVDTGSYGYCNTGPIVGDQSCLEDTFNATGTELHWTEESTATANDANWTIMGYFLPSRTRPLGQSAIDDGSASPATSEVDMTAAFGYGASNQDHSAQYMSTYAVRKQYFLRLLRSDGFSIVQGQ